MHAAFGQRVRHRHYQFSRYQTEPVAVNLFRNRIVNRHRHVIQRHLDRIRIQAADVGGHNGGVLQNRPHSAQLGHFGPVSRLNRVDYRRLRIHDHFPGHERRRSPGQGINGHYRHVVVSFGKGNFTGEPAADTVHFGPARQLVVGIDHHRPSAGHVGQVD